MNPYTTTPYYETKNLTLRLICPEDAADLLICYSDPEAIARMNADNCIDNFLCTKLDHMEGAIAAWLGEYKAKNFVRLSIIPKKYGKAVGTVEMFCTNFPVLGQSGILRIDLASEFETPCVISELTELAIESFVPDFAVHTLLVKAGHLPERLAVFKDYGFVPTEAFRPGGGYYAWFKI